MYCFIQQNTSSNSAQKNQNLINVLKMMSIAFLGACLSSLVLAYSIMYMLFDVFIILPKTEIENVANDMPKCELLSRFIIESNNSNSQKIFIILFIFCTLLSFVMYALLGLAIKYWVIIPTRKKISNLEEDISLLERDELTGLFKREILKTRKSHYENDYQSLGLFFIDINYLKQTNDTYGHAAGDELITSIANALKTLKEYAPYIDLYRHGGDEFIAILPEASENDISLLLTIIHAKIRIVNLKKSDITPSIAIGWAYAENKPINLDEIIKQADKNMYANKKAIKAFDRAEKEKELKKR